MHDPLCDWQPGEPQPDGSVLAWTCQCETIAKARADQTERITSAVDALPFKCALSLEPADCNQSCDDGPCSCSGIRREVAWTTARSDVLDAIAAVESVFPAPRYEAEGNAMRDALRALLPADARP